MFYQMPPTLATLALLTVPWQQNCQCGRASTVSGPGTLQRRGEAAPPGHPQRLWRVAAADERA
jgi:hypothetical protein